MKKIARYLAACLFLAAILWACVPGSLAVHAQTQPIAVYYKTTQLSSDTLYAIERDGTVMIPYKVLTASGRTGVTAKWKASKKRLRLVRNNINLEMYKGKKEVVRNDEMSFTLPQKVCYSTMAGVKQVMVPAKKICHLLGLTYSYDKTTATVTLKPKKAVTTYSKTMKAKAFLLMSTEQFVKILGPIAQKNYHKSGVLASVTLAQAIHESWSGTSLLAQKGNNLFGMKKVLSGNNWSGSAWKGKVYVKKTKEQYGGKTVTIKAAFRKYDNVEQSIQDHSAYLVNSKNGSSRRYKGLTATKSYKKQIAILQKGGYCTFSNYGKNLIKEIKKYNLTKYDK